MNFTGFGFSTESKRTLRKWIAGLGGCFLFALSGGLLFAAVSPDCRVMLDQIAVKRVVGFAEKVKADIAIVQDPDANKIGVAARDRSGEYRHLNGNQISTVLAYYLLNRLKERGELKPEYVIVKSFLTTDLIAEMASDFGIKTVNVAPGPNMTGRQIGKIKKSHDKVFLAAFEDSFVSLIGMHARDKDGVVAAAMMAEAAAWAKAQGMTLWGLLDSVYSKYGYFQEHTETVKFVNRDGIEAVMGRVRNGPPGPNLLGLPVTVFRDYKEEGVNGDNPDVVELQLMGGEAVVYIRPSGRNVPELKIYVKTFNKTHKKDLRAAKGRVEFKTEAVLRGVLKYINDLNKSKE